MGKMVLTKSFLTKNKLIVSLVFFLVKKINSPTREIRLIIRIEIKEKIKADTIFN